MCNIKSELVSSSNETCALDTLSPNTFRPRPVSITAPSKETPNNFPVILGSFWQPDVIKLLSGPLVAGVRNDRPTLRPWTVILTMSRATHIRNPELRTVWLWKMIQGTLTSTILKSLIWIALRERPSRCFPSKWMLGFRLYGKPRLLMKSGSERLNRLHSCHHLISNPSKSAAVDEALGKTLRARNTVWQSGNAEIF